MAESPKNKQTLYLIDGSALIYRAFFAFIRNPLINSRGENTSAPFGFTGSLLKLIREENPDHLAVIFDTKAPTFRHKLYKEYKSTRAKMPEELVAQLPRIRQVVEALSIPSYEQEGFEADDLIGSLAHQGAKAGLDVWIVSGDKDFCQLVDDDIHIYNSKKSSEPPERLDREGVKAKMGVYPELVIDLLAMMGDSSDNVPGIPGVGPKTAIALLEQFGSLENTLEKFAEIKAKGVRQKVSDNKELALLSKELVTIVREAPIELDLTELRRSAPDQEKVRQLFGELEFSGFLKEALNASVSDLDSDNSTNTDNSTDNVPGKKRSVSEYHLVKTLTELKTLIAEMLEQTEVAVDTETTSLSHLEAELVGVSLCARAGEAYYIPLAHTTTDTNLDRKAALAEISRLLLSDTVQKTGQNIKYDLHIFANAGLTVNNIGFDTMLAAYTIDPSSRAISLDKLAYDRLGHQMTPISDLIGKGKKQISFAETPVEQAADYAAEDADYTYRLRGVLEPEIKRLGLDALYFDIELPLIEILLQMERVGVNINVDYLRQMSVELEKEIDAVQRSIFKELGRELNLNSPQQLSVALFEDLSLPTKGKTAKKTGYSTDVRVLEELAELHPVPKMVLEYRQLTKLKNTYVDALPALVNKRTGRVHTTFNQTIAATGRLSSTDPNLQNIPIRTEMGRRIRRAFVPADDNHLIVSADYSQIELRVLAHVSQDKGLIAAFVNDEDIHSRTAAEVFGVGLEEVTSDQRRVAKTANFAVIYGVSAYGLSRQSDMDVAQSKEFIETYFARYPGIKKYMDETITFARDKGYVETLTGRRRQISEINSSNFQMRQFAERIAINTPIQGTAADIIKIAMLAIHQRLKGMKSHLILQVHDELVFDTERSELERLSKLVIEEMEGAMKLKVPLTVSLGVGPNWLDAK